MAKFLNDFPAGPLSSYRKKASFDWKKMKIFLETEEIVKYKHDLYEKVRKSPVLIRECLETPKLSEVRRIANEKLLAFRSMNEFSFMNYLDNLKKPSAAGEVVFNIDPSTSIKHSVSFGMVPSILQSLGTEQHYHYVNDIFDGKVLGCFCLTEIGHGSNSKNMKTTATYDKDSGCFVLNTPNFEAAKCWAGGLGQSASLAIIMAQLITPDGISHGLHAFVVEIRNPATLLPYPGITIGDMGEKMGLNGIDNGFIMFDQYRIPKSALLSKTGNVTEDGKYVTPFKDANKRHGASLGALSMGRLNITNICAIYATKAITIALRYAAVRKQFGPENNGEEMPILEYQSHQHRLLPYLALAYVLRYFASYIVEEQYTFTIEMVSGVKNDYLTDLGLEMHAISSACKPVAGWSVRNAVQECRESCAGHGYLKVAGIGDIRNEQDANCTYEGENHILIQQTSNWLLKLWPQILNGQKVQFPLHSVDFLSDYRNILNQKFSANSTTELTDPQYILLIYKWLVCYLLKISHEKYEEKIRQGLDAFWAKNETQVFYAKSLAVAYIEHFMLYVFHNKICEATDPNIKKLLTKLFSLCALCFLEKHLPSFYQGEFTTGPKLTHLLQDSILELCRDVKDDAIALVDVIAPPDFLLHSVLGKSDGEVYKHLESAIYRSPNAFTRPSWWRNITGWNADINSKL